MALIDPRVLPLIDALAASGADWLAFELFDALHVGRTSEDSDEELNQARMAVRAFRHEERLPEKRDFPTPTPTPIVGDEQIDWAASYVADRISGSIWMLDASLNHLESIVSKSREAGARSNVTSAQPQRGVALRLEGEQTLVRQAQIREGIAGLSALKEALSGWAKSVKSDGRAP